MIWFRICASVLMAAAFACAAQAGDETTGHYYSPDGRYDVRFHTSGENRAVRQVQVVDVASGASLISRDYDAQGHGSVVWSNDSKRFAVYVDVRRGGSTEAYEIKRAEIRPLSIPDFDSPVAKDIKLPISGASFAAHEPMRWEKDNLVLNDNGKVRVDARRGDSDVVEWVNYSYDVIVDFNRKGRGKVKKVRQTSLIVETQES